MIGDLDWRPYSAHVSRPKVREIITRGEVEYELCLEGGSYVVRRTVRKGRRIIVSEAARGVYRRAVDAWEMISVSGS